MLLHQTAPTVCQHPHTNVAWSSWILNQSDEDSLFISSYRVGYFLYCKSRDHALAPVKTPPPPYTAQRVWPRCPYARDLTVYATCVGIVGIVFFWPHKPEAPVYPAGGAISSRSSPATIEGLSRTAVGHGHVSSPSKKDRSTRWRQQQTGALGVCAARPVLKATDDPSCCWMPSLFSPLQEAMWPELSWWPYSVRRWIRKKMTVFTISPLVRNLRRLFVLARFEWFQLH